MLRPFVELRPIDNPDIWHKKSGQEAFGQPKIYEVLYDPETGKYATGLTDEELAKYSRELSVDLAAPFNPDIPHPFYGSKAGAIKCENRTMFFDPSKPKDYVLIAAMKASKFIANSINDIDKWPFATHVLFDENDEVAEKEIKINKKYQAIELLGKMSTDDKANLVQILSNKMVRGRTTNFINVEIDNLIENDVDNFIRYAKMDKAETYTRAALLESIHRNILTKEGTSIFYMGDKIGSDYEDAVRWFLDPQNSQMKVRILEKLNPSMQKVTATAPASKINKEKTGEQDTIVI